MDELSKLMNRLTAEGEGSPQGKDRHSKMPIFCEAKESDTFSCVAPIIGQIGPISDYYGLLSALEFANEKSVIRILLDTPGGRVDTSVVLANAICCTKATVIGVATGQVMSSASTFIFPACKQFEIRAGSRFMFHSTLQGQQGKSLAIRDSTMSVIEYIKQQLEKVINLGMLTAEELDKIMGTKATVFHSGQVIKARMQQKGLAVT